VGPRELKKMKPLPMTPPDMPATPTDTNDTAGLVRDQAKTDELGPKIIDAIRTVYDPEIPVNIYELGLIYDVFVDVSGIAGIRMTLTAPGCPAGPMRRSTSSGNRPGRRTGCRTRRSSSSECGER
jgi:hypothetical protein